LARNRAYSGPASGSITALRLLPFTSDEAEFDELISGTSVDYGYVPFNDLPQLSRVKSEGYTIDPWPSWGITFINLNFVDPQFGGVFDQLYFRQAFQELVDQPAYIKTFLYGDGNPTYGPVPLIPASEFVSPQENANPYPYDPAGAATLLRSHGWSIVPNGADVCLHAGTGSGECGAGVSAGTKLAISLLYNSGLEDINEEVAALRSEASTVGIDLLLSEAPFSDVVSKAVYCAKPNCWQMDYYGQGWYWDPGYEVPDGGAIFASTGESNGESYSNPTADQLIDGLQSGGYSAIYTYENYLAKQLPAIWMPEIDVQVSAVSNALGGALPQDPLTNIYPENWFLNS
ncbi:MAG TPA: ABC transporter substrate-binding protein, partial [Acidimicrobiales bacterium]|nr:ABC transporter substrate-binding protein [Acidimicrobiales bacterium]